LAVVRNEQRAGQDEHLLRSARHCAVEWGNHIVGRIFEFERLRLHVEQSGGPLGRGELVGRKSVEENRQSGPVWKRLREQFDLLLRQLQLLGGHAGNVAARSCQAGHIAAGNRIIIDCDHDDRNGEAGAYDGLQCDFGTGGDDQIGP
jgi:hypothetical protein